ncbi:MAG TPA: hypothetical protein VGO36_04510 [Solirubrobacterales bacterium]|nr:hypothetical protein [Solirubrobacterales bacterium]
MIGVVEINSDAKLSTNIQFEKCEVARSLLASPPHSPPRVRVILRMTAVIARPISGSAIGRPSATTIAVAMTARTVEAVAGASADDCCDPIADKSDQPGGARPRRWVAVWGWICREIASSPATQAETKIVATTNSPAQRSARRAQQEGGAERDRGWHRRSCGSGRQ